MQSDEIIDNRSDAPNFEDGTKLTAEQKLCLWDLIRSDPNVPSSGILNQAVSIDITIRHLNRLRTEWGLSRPKGRPRKSDARSRSELLPEPIRLESNVSFIGVHIFSCWMEMQEEFPMISELLKMAIELHVEENPTDSFPLLSHKDETLMRRFKALFYAPLFHVGKLIEYDVKEHALESVIGRGFLSSTLNQFLAQLERIDAAPQLMNSLIPLDVHGDCICFIDGHMIPFWSRRSMHKGKITMLGRIMPGSQAVAAHIEDGRAIFFDYLPPDIRLPKIILDFCGELAAQR